MLQHAKVHQEKKSTFLIFRCFYSHNAFRSADFEETLIFEEYTFSFSYLISGKCKTSGFAVILVLPIKAMTEDIIGYLCCLIDFWQVKFSYINFL